jgi:2'-5' RNA ligase
LTEPRVRLFVALDLPEEARAELVRWREPALHGQEGLRAVGPESLHATLCFLGQRPEADVERVAGLVRAAAEPHRAPALGLGAARWLPSRTRPRVLSVELDDGPGALAELHHAVGEALEEAGLWKFEHRRFLPHVTVARVRHGARVRGVELPLPPALPFAGAAVTLYQSHLGGGPARYEARSRVVLG